MTDLGRIFTRHGSDKATRHTYDAVYEALLSPVRSSIRRLLEVGVLYGASLRAWHEWLPEAAIVGLDNGSQDGSLDLVWRSDNSRISVVHADSRYALPSSMVDTYDVIIDDGTHTLEAQTATLRNLFPALAPGGFYIIEDVESIENATALAALFHGTPLDLRSDNQRWDNILVVVRRPAHA